MRFGTKDHLGVKIQAGATGYFRWNFSRWDGGDTWAPDSAESFPFVDFNSVCSEIQISMGLTVQGYDAQPEGSQATIILVADDADPLDGLLIKVGNEVNLTLESYPSGTSSVPFWKGYVKSIQRDTDADGMNRVLITCGDRIEQLMSTVATISEIADQKFSDRWQSIYNAYPGSGLVLTGASPIYEEFTFPGIDIFEVPLQDTINETMAGEIGWLVVTRFGEIWPMSHGYLQHLLGQTAQYEIHQDVTDAHIPPTYINQSSNTDGIISTVIARLTWDTATEVKVTNQDNADLYGNSTLEVELNLADETQLTNWANYALTLTDQDAIKALSVDAYDHRNMSLHKVYEWSPGTCVLVNVQAGLTNVNQNYLISKINHMITPETWVTDLELWRN